MSWSNEIIQVIMALLGSIGFGILFNLRGRRLMLAGLGGMLGWIIYLILYRITGHEVVSYGLATVLTTLYSQAMARIVKSPATLFLVLFAWINIRGVRSRGNFQTLLVVLLVRWVVRRRRRRRAG